MFVLRSTFLKQQALLNAAYLKIGELIRANGELDLEVELRNDTIRSQADTIRAMDQLIYQMTQCSSWESMRPYFNQLQASASDRQRTESDRINNLLRGELLSVYAPKKETNP